MWLLILLVVAGGLGVLKAWPYYAETQVLVAEARAQLAADDPMPDIVALFALLTVQRETMAALGECVEVGALTAEQALEYAEEIMAAGRGR
jgi:hypothetical protein